MKSTEEPRSNSWTYSRKVYQQNYAKDNREAINARKRAWRLARKNLSGVGIERAATTQVRASIATTPPLKPFKMNPTLSSQTTQRDRP